MDTDGVTDRCPAGLGRLDDAFGIELLAGVGVVEGFVVWELFCAYEAARADASLAGVARRACLEAAGTFVTALSGLFCVPIRLLSVGWTGSIPWRAACWGVGGVTT